VSVSQKQVSHLAFRPPRLGRECAFYRWVQDEKYVYVTIPLPSVPPRNDVSLVIGPEEFGVDVVFPKREIEGVRGLFAGDVSPELSRWDLADDPVEGPSLEVVVAKTPTPAYSTMWHAFLENEEARPTVQFAGVCAATGARFRQYADFFEVELDVPDTTRPDDVRVDVSAERWTLSVQGLESGGGSGRLRGRVLPDDTNWLFDDLSPTSPYYGEAAPMKTLYITLRKEAATNGQTAHWWPGLSEPLIIKDAFHSEPQQQ